MTTTDLVRLRDIGQPDASLFGSPSPLAASPDGTRLAFVVNRADPIENVHCRVLMVIETRAGAAAKVVDRGGDLITITDIQRNLYRAGGFPQLIQPAWSPDGRWIAYLRRDHGRTQAWRVAADGSSATMATHADSDVEAVAWSDDGRRLIFATRPGAVIQARQAVAEGRRGFHYDERFVPNSSAWPKIRSPIPRAVFTIDLATQAVTEASASDNVALPNLSTAGSTGPLLATAESGATASTVRSGTSPLSPMIVQIRLANGQSLPCASSACSGPITGMWWNRSGTELRYLRREGWAHGQMGLYRLRVGSERPDRILLTDDVLLGCLEVQRELACMVESARMPRRIIALNPDTGHRRLLYDPNPEFRNITLGPVRRLTWRNTLGLAAWGDLVLPPGWRPGAKLPMIVVQYHSDGFLRGGTGDEYPIFAMAAKGLAVLSVERPAFFGASLTDLKTTDEIIKANGMDWAERRSLLSSLQTGVQQAIDLGIADPCRFRPRPCKASPLV